MMKSLGIACASGSFKGVFVHGVLSAFESLGLIADAYAGASSSTLSTTCAAIGKAQDAGVEYWYKALDFLEKSGYNMSEAVLQTIAEYSPILCSHLFLPDTPRLIIATSAVTTLEGAEQTQGNGAKRLGRKLLLSAIRRDRSWVNANLETYLFDSASTEDRLRLNEHNFKEVAYASTRMLHEWDTPAWVDKKPFVDASYTCSCPAIDLAQLGYKRVIAIATEPGELYQDLFQTTAITSNWKDTSIYIIKPDVDIKELGVDFTSASQEGIERAYNHGKDKGKEFIDKGGLI